MDPLAESPQSQLAEVLGTLVALLASIAVAAIRAWLRERVAARAMIRGIEKGPEETKRFVRAEAEAAGIQPQLDMIVQKETQ